MADFRLERYFAEHEFSLAHTISASECEPLSLEQVLARADADLRGAWRAMRLSYGPSEGDPRLRSAIAETYELTSAQQVITVVPEEGIYIAMRCLLRAGDHIVCMSPGYQSLSEVAASLGCEVSRWWPRETERWQFELDELAGLLRPDTRAIVINSPHNPTGAYLDARALETIVEWASARGAFVFSDEMYRGLELGGRPLAPAVCDLYAAGVSLSGVSKSLALPGVRVGWLATRHQELLAACQAMKDYTTICGAVPSELLATMVLRDRVELWAQHGARVTAHSRQFGEFCRAHGAGLQWRAPEAGTVGLARVEGSSASELARVAREREQLLVVPSACFDFGDAHVRIGLGHVGFGAQLERLARVLAAL